MEGKAWVVYCHTNKVNGKKYVGTTRQELPKRWRKGKGYTGNRLIYQAFSEYGWDNFDHDVLKAGLTQQEAYFWEQFYIHALGTLSPDGYNLQSGGASGYKSHPETKEILRAERLGTTISEEVRQKMSESHKARGITQKQREQIHLLGLSNRGKVFSMASREKMSKSASARYARNKNQTDQVLRKNAEAKRSPVCQYDQNLNLICEYSSITEAAEKCSIPKSMIIRCLKGDRKSTHGYVWKYREVI